MSNILVINNLADIKEQLAEIFEDLRLNAVHTKSVIEARNSQAASDFSLIICGPEISKEAVTRQKELKSIPIIALGESGVSKQAEVENKRSSHNFISCALKDLQKHISIMFKHNVDSAAESSTKKAQASSTVLRRSEDQMTTNQSTQTTETPPVPYIIGSCQNMQDVFRRIKKGAPTKSTVLIRGETGTGKELVARAIHDCSERASKPFVAVNCAAIPETLIESELFGHEKGAFTGAAGKRSGLIEAAEGGTLFLDEIGELPPEAQARLLRFIQEGEIRRIGSNESHPVDVRLISATHRDLKELTKTGQFRPDLYYRINVFKIMLPALRERGHDLIEIAEALISKAALKHDKPGLHLSPSAIAEIIQYRWPGNIRELENVIERAAIMSDDNILHSSDLELELDDDSVAQPTAAEPPKTIPSDQPIAYEPDADLLPKGRRLSSGLREPEEGDMSLEDYFQRFVLEHQNRLSETELAKRLGISRKCLWERRQKFGIPREKKKKS